VTFFPSAKYAGLKRKYSPSIKKKTPKSIDEVQNFDERGNTFLWNIATSKKKGRGIFSFPPSQ
jgi:hypothetical protein